MLAAVHVRRESAEALKQQLVKDVLEPFSIGTSRLARGRAAALTAAGDLEGARIVFGVGAGPVASLASTQRSVALGVAPYRGQFKLAVRVQRPSLAQSPLMDRLTRHANGEVDVRLVGRIDKRAKGPRTAQKRMPLPPAALLPWYQRNTRPLLIGASVGHVEVTAGTIGAFVKRGAATYILSNNHVLANENLANVKDWILQRAVYDGGEQPTERVARLRFWVLLKRAGTNFTDAALARIERGVRVDTSLLRELVNGMDRRLAGLGPQAVDEGEAVFKIGRTTGPTKGRVTAFNIDHVIINYDMGNLRFDNLIEIEGMGTQAFSDGGDSGSLVVNTRMEAVALLFAGSDSGGSNGFGLTYASPIHRVLQDLRATLLF